MGKNVYIEVDEGLKYLLGPRHRALRSAFLRQALTDWSEHATSVQRIYAPIGQSGYLHAHIGHGSPIYQPGAPAGGGGWAVSSGVRRGTSDHPFYVHFGTKNPPGQTSAAMLVGGVGDQGRIYPKGTRSARIYQDDEGEFKMRRQVDYIPGLGPFRVRRRASSFAEGKQQPALTFQKRGEPRRFRAWVSGQAPKPFVYFAFLETSVYARAQLPSLAQDMFPNAIRESS